MQWWCSAQSGYWTWVWQPFLGVWILVGLIAAGYRRAWSVRDDAELRRAEPVSFAAGLFLLWLSLGWPLAALGATYLSTAHMVQYTLITAAAPPLLLRGLSDDMQASLLRRPVVGRLVELLTRPLVALGLFTAVLLATHLPPVLDTLMATQVGSFAMDILWLASGLALWWPIVCRRPERPSFRMMWKLAYLFTSTIPPTIVGLFLVYAGYPVYSTYELSPPVFGVSALGDQQVAGLVMKFGGGIIVWTVMTVLFFRWYREESSEAETGPPRPERAAADRAPADREPAPGGA